MPLSSNQILGFIFDQTDLRGEVVSIDEAYQTVANNNQLPPVLQRLQGEFLAAASLLSNTLKFEGTITLQARGEGVLPVIMAECDHHKGLRGIAKPDEDCDFSQYENANLRELLGEKGVLVITIDPEQGTRYQGIVPLDADDLAGCLEHYFMQSEQLQTRFWLAVDEQRAAALMIQALPQQESSPEQHEDQWQTITALADTVRDDELLGLEHETLLFRLFHEHQVRLLGSKPVNFKCSCSRRRSASSLATLGLDDIAQLIQEQGKISVDCQFCNQHYSFSASDIPEIFPDQAPTLH